MSSGGLAQATFLAEQQDVLTRGKIKSGCLPSHTTHTHPHRSLRLHHPSIPRSRHTSTPFSHLKSWSIRSHTHLTSAQTQVHRLPLLHPARSRFRSSPPPSMFSSSPSSVLFFVVTSLGAEATNYPRANVCVFLSQIIINNNESSVRDSVGWDGGPLSLSESGIFTFTFSSLLYFTFLSLHCR